MQQLTQKSARLGELVDYLRRNGHPVGEMLSDLGVTTKALEDDARLPIETIAEAWEVAARITGDDLLGLRLGEQVDMRTPGLIAYVGIAAPTVEALIRNLARYRRVFSDAIEIDVSALESEGTVEWFYAVPASVTRRQLVEFNAANTVHTLRALSRRHIRPVEVRLTHPRRVGLEAFERFFSCPVQFGAGRNMLRLRPGDLALDLHTADDRLHTILKGYCEEILSRRATVPSRLVTDVEREVSRLLSSGEFRQDRVARELGMSARTLSRRLADAGTSFGDVVARLREALSRTYVVNSDLSVTEIAFLLGYSDPGTFSSAFRRWTGTTPRAFRAAAR